MFLNDLIKPLLAFSNDKNARLFFFYFTQFRFKIFLFSVNPSDRLITSTSSLLNLLRSQISLSYTLALILKRRVFILIVYTNVLISLREIVYCQPIN